MNAVYSTADTGDYPNMEGAARQAGGWLHLHDAGLGQQPGGVSASAYAEEGSRSAHRTRGGDLVFGDGLCDELGSRPVLRNGSGSPRRRKPTFKPLKRRWTGGPMTRKKASTRFGKTWKLPKTKLPMTKRRQTRKPSRSLTQPSKSSIRNRRPTYRSRTTIDALSRIVH
jgi:hypothetical protein